MAAALALRGRQLGKNVLVVTVDPAKRLASALQLDLSGVEERLVPTVEATQSHQGVDSVVPVGRLHAAVIDSKKVFDGFIQRHSTDPDLMKRLAKNRLYDQLSTTLSGSQEFTALERLLQACEAGYDLIILDTPPTQHAIDFLSAPERIRGLFQEGITKWFMNPKGQVGFLGQGIVSSIIGRGTRAALKSLEILTGARFIEELIDFFESMQAIQIKLRERTEDVNALLRSQKSVFVLVTSFDVAKLKEAQHLNTHLKAFGYRLGACILNRAFPEILLSDEELVAESAVPAALRPNLEKLRTYHAELRRDHEARFQQFDLFERDLRERGTGSEVAVLRIPEYRQDLAGLADLEELAKFLAESDGRSNS